MGQRWLDGYSANVEIYLLINGERYDVAQLGGGTLILREPASILPFTDAELIVKIDGHEEIRHVFLSGGADIDQYPVGFRSPEATR